MIQNSGEYSALIWGKVYICENTGSLDAYFKMLGVKCT